MKSGSNNRTEKGKFGRHLATSNRGGGSKNPATPLVIIEHERRDQQQLCNSLELVADQLREKVDGYLCESIYKKLRFDLPVYHRNEESLFGLISRNTPTTLEVAQIIKCVRQEHAIHNCYADELYDSLRVLRSRGDIQSYDAIGYMLRCCFETMRRHLKWEDLTLMPLADRYLTTEDLANLSAMLAENRRDIGLNIV